MRCTSLQIFIRVTYCGQSIQLSQAWLLNYSFEKPQKSHAHFAIIVVLNQGSQLGRVMPAIQTPAAIALNSRSECIWSKKHLIFIDLKSYSNRHAFQICYKFFSQANGFVIGRRFDLFQNQYRVSHLKTYDSKWL